MPISIRPEPTIKLVSKGPDHALGELAGHLIGIWDGTILLNSLQIWQRELQSRVRAAPGRVIYLSYERSGFQMPGDMARQLIADTLRSVDGKLAACAVVLPGQGFTSAAVRALVSGLALVVRPKSPLRSVSNIEEAQTWVAQQLGPGVPWPDAQALHSAILELEAEFDKAPPPSQGESAITKRRQKK